MIRWGIIGCGDVTEVKSGPAFNKVPDSRLVAVMRRDGEKAADYARRHQVPRWYDKAADLIGDPEVNAIYIATPPSSHEQLAMAAIAAGKPLYLEKPMTMSAESAARIVGFANEQQARVTVAHYRRAQPFFKKIKELIDSGAIGKPRTVRLDLLKAPMSGQDLANPGKAWRVNPEIAGGGLFHDLAPHQLDLMIYLFGPAASATGYAVNQSRLFSVPDTVAGTITFQSGPVFSGTWCFCVAGSVEKDECEITGDAGSISFSVFDQHPIVWKSPQGIQHFVYDPLPHVQQPMIADTVRYFLGQGPNPCSAAAGYETMKLIDSFSPPVSG